MEMGPTAAQHLVDRIQAALRAGEEDRAGYYDRVLKVIQLAPRMLSELPDRRAIPHP